MQECIRRKLDHSLCRNLEVMIPEFGGQKGGSRSVKKGKVSAEMTILVVEWIYEVRNKFYSGFQAREGMLKSVLMSMPCVIKENKGS